MDGMGYYHALARIVGGDEGIRWNGGVACRMKVDVVDHENGQWLHALKEKVLSMNVKMSFSLAYT